jgi:hypothetical protein
MVVHGRQYAGSVRSRNDKCGLRRGDVGGNRGTIDDIGAVIDGKDRTAVGDGYCRSEGNDERDNAPYLASRDAVGVLRASSRVSGRDTLRILPEPGTAAGSPAGVCTIMVPPKNECPSAIHTEGHRLGCDRQFGSCVLCHRYNRAQKTITKSRRQLSWQLVYPCTSASHLADVHAVALARLPHVPVTAVLDYRRASPNSSPIRYRQDRPQPSSLLSGIGRWVCFLQHGRIPFRIKAASFIQLEMNAYP